MTGPHTVKPHFSPFCGECGEPHYCKADMLACRICMRWIYRPCRLKHFDRCAADSTQRSSRSRSTAAAARPATRRLFLSDPFPADDYQVELMGELVITRAHQLNVVRGRRRRTGQPCHPWERSIDFPS